MDANLDKEAGTVGHSGAGGSLAGESGPGTVMRAFRPVILAFPGGGDSYTDCFYAALAKQGAVIRRGQYSGRWLLANLSGADFAHFHWPSFYYAGSTASVVIFRTLKFFALLLVLRMNGVRIVWTAHNLYPHERNSPAWIDCAVRVVLCRLSVLVLAHGKEAARIVAREFGLGSARVIVIEHGNFLDYYPRHGSRAEARHRLGLPDAAFVFLFIGNCRRYKNVHELVDCFQKQASAGDARLLIAGKCPDGSYRSEIDELIRRDPRFISFEPHFIPDQDLQYYLRAADAVVLPFKDVLTSGSAILALSFGRPVVAPRLGYLADLVTAECGLLYDPGDEHALRDAMVEARQRHFDEARIESHAASLHWDRSAATVLAALKATR
jgi:glycosyltransferase involved in cell wall biosynthesis